MTRVAIAALLLVVSAVLTPAVQAEEGPKRIVTLGSDITEIVYTLGEGQRIVGRDSTSVYPPDVEKIADVGYFRQLGAEGVLSLKPDLIIVVIFTTPDP